MSSHDDGAARPDEAVIGDASLGEQYERLAAVLSDYRAASEPPEPESSVKERIMGIVRQESLRGPSTELRTPNNIGYCVATAAIRAEIRGAIDAFDGLRARKTSIRETSPGTSRFTVETSMTMARRLAVHKMMPDVRHSIAGRLKSVFGIEVSSIDVRVEDVHHD